MARGSYRSCPGCAPGYPRTSPACSPAAGPPPGPGPSAEPRGTQPWGLDSGPSLPAPLLGGPLACPSLSWCEAPGVWCRAGARPGAPQGPAKVPWGSLPCQALLLALPGHSQARPSPTLSCCPGRGLRRTGAGGWTPFDVTAACWAGAPGRCRPAGGMGTGPGESVPSTCSGQTTRTLLHVGQEVGDLRHPGCVLAGASPRWVQGTLQWERGWVTEGLAVAASTPHRGQKGRWGCREAQGRPGSHCRDL